MQRQVGQPGLQGAGTSSPWATAPRQALHTNGVTAGDVYKVTRSLVTDRIVFSPSFKMRKYTQLRKIFVQRDEQVPTGDGKHPRRCTRPTASTASLLSDDGSFSVPITWVPPSLPNLHAGVPTCPRCFSSLKGQHPALWLLALSGEAQVPISTSGLRRELPPSQTTWMAHCQHQQLEKLKTGTVDPTPPRPSSSRLVVPASVNGTAPLAQKLWSHP